MATGGSPVGSFSVKATGEPPVTTANATFRIAFDCFLKNFPILYWVKRRPISHYLTEGGLRRPSPSLKAARRRPSDNTAIVFGGPGWLLSFNLGRFQVTTKGEDLMNATRICTTAMSVIICGITGFAVPVLASRCAAEGVHIVVPNQYENAEAPNFGGIPTGPFRFQQVFAASQFSSLPPGQRTIVSFALRPDASVTEPVSFTLSDTVIRMSTTNRNPGELSLMFSENVGPDEVVVFQGDLSFSTDNTGPAGGPKDFDFVFGLQTPFAYDPGEGNLIFDIVTAGTNLTISQTTDFVVQPGPDFEEVVGSGQLAGFRYGGNVVQFTFVPEPSTAVLLLFGTCAALTSLRNRRARETILLRGRSLERCQDVFRGDASDLAGSTNLTPCDK